MGICLLGDTTTGIILFITHLLSCLTTGFLFRFWKYNSNKNYKTIPKESNTSVKKLATFSNLGEILSLGINNAISTVIMIGGFVVLFSVIISMLNKSHILQLLCNIINPILSIFNIPTDFSSGIISGIIELTNGVKSISAIPCKAISTNIIITAFLLGFGGFSVLLQVWGIISKTDISILPYFIAKILQGILANFKFINLDLGQITLNYNFLFIGLVVILFVFLIVKFLHYLSSIITILHCKNH